MRRSYKIKKRRVSRRGGGMPVSNSWELGQKSSRNAQKNMESLVKAAGKNSEMALEQALTLQASKIGTDNPEVKNNINTAIQPAAIATQMAFDVKDLQSISPEVKKELIVTEEKSQSASVSGNTDEQLRSKADTAKTLTGTPTGNSKIIEVLNNVETVPPLWKNTIMSTFDSAAKRSPQELANLAATYLNAVTSSATNKYPKHLADIIVSTPSIAICIVSQAHRYEEAISILNSKNPLVRDTLAKYAPTAVANKPLANKPLANTPLANKPLANKPLANTPLANKPLANKPLANKPLANKPLANKPFEIKYPENIEPYNFTVERMAPYIRNYGREALTLIGVTTNNNAIIDNFTSVPLTQQSQANDLFMEIVYNFIYIGPQHIADVAASCLNKITSSTKYPKNLADIIVATPLIAMTIASQASRFPEAISILTNANPGVKDALAKFLPAVANTPAVANKPLANKPFEIKYPENIEPYNFTVETMYPILRNRGREALTLVGVTTNTNEVIDNFTSVPLTEQSQADDLFMEFIEKFLSRGTQSIADGAASCLNKITSSTKYPKNLADIIVATPLIAMTIASQASRFPEAISILTKANPGVKDALAKFLPAEPSTGGYKHSRQRGGAPPGFAEGQIVSQSKRLQSLAEARGAAATAELAKSQASNVVAATVGAKPNSLQSTLPRLAYKKAEEATRMASSARILTAPFQGVRNAMGQPAANGETAPGTELGMGAEDGTDEEGPSSIDLASIDLASTVIGNPNLEDTLATVEKLNNSTSEELPYFIPNIVHKIIDLTREGHLVVADMAATYLNALKTYKNKYPAYFAKMIVDNPAIAEVIATQIIDYKEEVRFLETVSSEAARLLRENAPPEVVIEQVDVSREPDYRMLIKNSFQPASKSIGDIRQNVTYIRKLDVLQEGGEANIIYSNVIRDFFGAISNGGPSIANITATYLNAVNIYKNNYPKHFINIIRNTPSIMACIEAKRGDYEAEVRNLETIEPLLTRDLDSVEQILGLSQTVDTVQENLALEKARRQFQQASTITGNTHGSVLHIRKLNPTEDTREIAKITSYIINDFIASVNKNAEEMADIAALYLSYATKDRYMDNYPFNFARIIENNQLIATCISAQRAKYPAGVNKLNSILPGIIDTLEEAVPEAARSQSAEPPPPESDAPRPPTNAPPANAPPTNAPPTNAPPANAPPANTPEEMTGGYRKIRLTRCYRKKRKSTRRTKKRKNRKAL